ncbi:hypothetical protein V6N13_109379 [Hibiscus sabdariffa]
MVPESLTPKAKDIGTYRSKDCSVETCVPDVFGMLGTEQFNRMWEGNQSCWLGVTVGEACVDHGVVDYIHEVDSVSMQHED